MKPLNEQAYDHLQKLITDGQLSYHEIYSETKLAKELGICVTAEGVESREQVEFLKNIDCDSIQGFYYSKPLPLAEYEMLLEA